MDYAFKIGAMAPQEERFACMMGNPHDKSAKIANVEAAVLFVQFEDGSTWGDDQAGKGMLAERPQKLAYLKRLVETYYESGGRCFRRSARRTGANVSRVHGGLLLEG